MDTQLCEPDDDFSFSSGDKLSSSCFAQIRCDKGPGDLDEEEDDNNNDDELTSLAWLQDADLLKNINAGEDDLPDEKENAADGGNKTEGSGAAGVGSGFVPQAHPPHIPYNPLKHVNSKPPYSFSCLIFMAVEDSPEKKLPVKDIYNWILTHFPYFQNAPLGWKNSVRHNLSLNKCFKKVEKDKGTVSTVFFFNQFMYDLLCSSLM
jgi:forkhead box protein N